MDPALAAVDLVLVDPSHLAKPQPQGGMLSVLRPTAFGRVR